MAITQNNRLVQVDSPLGGDVLLLQSMEGNEELGRLFHYELDLTSENRAITFDQLLGKPMGLTLELHDGSKRYFHGVVCSCRQVNGHGQFAGYRVSLRPWLWLLTRTSDCRIFQNKTVPEIIKQVFRDLGFSDFEDSLSGNYREWEYCVQYRETSFDFVSRLMEHEGIYYYFRHEQARHVLVFADAYGAHSTVADYDSVPFYPPDRQMRERDHFYDWQLEREVQPGSLELNDYDFKRPRARLEVRSSVSRSHSNGDHPLYDYPGEYVQSNDGEHYARTRIEAIHSQFERVQLRGRARGLGCGHLFKLTGYEREDQNREYLVVFARYQIRQELYENAQLDLSEQFTSELDCMDASQAFRPLPLTPMPIVRGPQTAVVVGPDGEEIWTDQYGRVKVHFYWDRHDQSNANSSCWMRVSQAWAGKNWGAVQIPRIGQEVIVSFIEGNPDRPIITGRVYNAEQTVPYTLPANATQSGVKSRSSKDGSPANFNEIRVEDKKGAEQLFIHAEKNQDIEVENDETHWVGHDRSKTIDNDETVHVKHDRTETVDHNETITIGVNRTESVGNNEDISIGVNRTESVGSNETISIGLNRTISVGASETATVALQRTHAVGINETIAIGAAQEVVIGAFQTVNVGAYQNVNVGLYQSTNVGTNRSVDVGANLSTTVKDNESRQVGAGRTTDIGKDDELTVGKNLVIDAGDSVTIMTGKASIVMKKDGTISISGKDITIDGSGVINIKANKNVVIKGRKILQN